MKKLKNKLHFWAYVSAALLAFTIIGPLCGETYSAVATGIALIFSMGMYAANAEDSIKEVGYPVFW